MPAIPVITECIGMPAIPVELIFVCHSFFFSDSRTVLINWIKLIKIIWTNSSIWHICKKPRSKSSGKFWIIQSRAVIIQSLATICDVTTVQVLSNETHTITFHSIWKYILPQSTFILRYVRAKMIVHTSVIELDQTDYFLNGLLLL